MATTTTSVSWPPGPSHSVHTGAQLMRPCPTAWVHSLAPVAVQRQCNAPVWVATSTDSGELLAVCGGMPAAGPGVLCARRRGWGHRHRGANTCRHSIKHAWSLLFLCSFFLCHRSQQPWQAQPSPHLPGPSEVPATSAHRHSDQHYATAFTFLPSATCEIWPVFSSSQPVNHLGILGLP